MVRKLLLSVVVALAFSGALQAQAAPADMVLNRFYQLKKSSPEGAAGYLSRYERRYSRDIRVRLELGYYYLNTGNKRAALPRFEAATRLAPRRADLWKQLGYIYLDLKQQRQALAAFRRAYAINPKDDELSLQIAYVLQSLGDNRGSARQFFTTIGSPTPSIASKSCKGYSTLRGLPNRLLPKPFFGEIYFAPEYNSRYRLGTFPLQMRLGVTLMDNPQLEAYLSLRSNWDNRSGVTGAGSQIYNDNVAVFAAGLRLKPFASIPLFVFIESGTAYDITYRLRPRWREDTRAGFQFYKEWNTELLCDATQFRIRPVADVYADGIYYTRYDGNVLFFGRFRPGLRLFETATYAIDSYVNLAISSDTQNAAGNRYQEIGAGVAFRLYDPIRINLRAEFVRIVRQQGLNSYNTFRVRLEHQSRF